MRFCPVFVVLSTHELGKTDLNGQLFFRLVLLSLLMLMHVCVYYGCAFILLRRNFESFRLTSVCFMCRFSYVFCFALLISRTCWVHSHLPLAVCLFSFRFMSTCSLHCGFIRDMICYYAAPHKVEYGEPDGPVKYERPICGAHAHCVRAFPNFCGAVSVASFLSNKRHESDTHTHTHTHTRAHTHTHRHLAWDIF